MKENRLIIMENKIKQLTNVVNSLIRAQEEINKNMIWGAPAPFS